jgi:hypothetical protein
LGADNTGIIESVTFVKDGLGTVVTDLTNLAVNSYLGVYVKIKNTSPTSTIGNFQLIIRWLKPDFTIEELTYNIQELFRNGLVTLGSYPQIKLSLSGSYIFTAILYAER